MAAPVWNTPVGSLGSYPGNSPLLITLSAYAVNPAAELKFKIISGNLPEGTEKDPIRMDMFGTIRGTLKLAVNQTEYKFTVRITDEHLEFSDRTFSITVSNENKPQFLLKTGEVVNTLDSMYVEYDIQYSNPVTTNQCYVNISSGELPPGLYMTETGKIVGYAEPPILPNKSPTKRTYTITVQLTSDYGNDTAIYRLTVRNQQLTQGPGQRRPVILNNRPRVYPIPTNDADYDFYTKDKTAIPVIESGEYFSYKIIGHDFENSPIEYKFSNLPTGLTGDENTGWITGIPVVNTPGLIRIDFGVKVRKKNNIFMVSAVETFPFYISNTIKQDIQWVTDKNLGTINNNTISDMTIEATSHVDLKYRLSGGKLPPNLQLLDNGQIIGKVSHQPTHYLMKQGESSEFKFTIEAYSPVYKLVNDTREFTLKVHQYYEKPVESVYFKVGSDAKNRLIVKDLLNDTSIIPDEYLYRPLDPYFGKAKDVRFIHAYGIPVNGLETYLKVVENNHYYRKILLGPVQTAIARDDNNNVIYEVVYSPIMDELMNKEGGSSPQQIIWPRNIRETDAGYTINNTTLFTAFEDNFTSQSPGRLRRLRPASLVNMRTQLTTTLGQNTDISLLPRWMTSQQRDGNTTGYIQAWVICHTLPGKSEIIKDNINNNWDHTLNEIDFSIDRYIIDKSSTFDWNFNLSIPTWGQLPSASPAPSPLDANDITILFPKPTILPRELDY